jgi:hypothetical protein
LEFRKMFALAISNSAGQPLTVKFVKGIAKGVRTLKPQRMWRKVAEFAELHGAATFGRPRRARVRMLESPCHVQDKSKKHQTDSL